VVRLDTFGPTVGNQGLEVKANGIRVNVKVFGDIHDRHRVGRIPEYREHVLPTAGWL